jgi:hypothetical protein
LAIGKQSNLLRPNYHRLAETVFSINENIYSIQLALSADSVSMYDDIFPMCIFKAYDVWFDLRCRSTWMY